MTTRKHEIEESQQDDTHACPFCMEREADSICDKCSKLLCIYCINEIVGGESWCPTCSERDRDEPRS